MFVKCKISLAQIVCYRNECKDHIEIDDYIVTKYKNQDHFLSQLFFPSAMDVLETVYMRQANAPNHKT